MDYKKLAELIFTNVNKTPDYYKEYYKRRELKPGAEVTRFAPSPTGFIHLGSLFTCLADFKIAQQSGGVVYLRIEDTDKKREVSGAVDGILDSLSKFGIKFDEGVTGELSEKGNYGPYTQSQRSEIYQTFVKWLMQKGLCYPCFCTHEDMEELKKNQMELGEQTGYYGKHAKCRSLSFEEVEKRIKNGDSYVIRLKSPGSLEKTIAVEDLIRGKLTSPERDIDDVLLKSDGIPTYHLAHVVDDFLMGTTIVIRGEEWISSLPLHVQLFELFELEVPKYAHLPTICKMDGNSKRKVSKRLDIELNVEIYNQQGFEAGAIMEYLMTLSNSMFEDWRIANPNAPIEKYLLMLENYNSAGPLFDQLKLNDVSKNYVSRLNAEQVFKCVLDWSKEFESQLYNKLSGEPDYYKKIFAIDRGGEKPRKDIFRWCDISEYYSYFDDENFTKSILEGYHYPENITPETAKNILIKYIEIYNEQDKSDKWFNKIRELAVQLGFAPDAKTYKKNKESYLGHVGDVAGVIRVSMTGRTQTPDLYSIMQAMGKDRVLARLNRALL